MFSGIIENMATVVAVKRDKENIDLTLECPFAGELSIDQSVAHNEIGRASCRERVLIEV